jgi:hyperosmotically inducible periplasmic protein
MAGVPRSSRKTTRTPPDGSARSVGTLASEEGIDVKRVLAAAALAAATVMTAAPLSAATGDRTQYKAALKRSAADYNEAMRQCRARPQAERTLCRTEAKAAARRSEAEAEAAYRNTPQARFDAKVAGANGDYSVERVKCRALAGDERRECLKSAKARQSQAIVSAIEVEHVRPRGPQPGGSTTSTRTGSGAEKTSSSAGKAAATGGAANGSDAAGRAGTAK